MGGKEEKKDRGLRITSDGELVGYDMLQARAWALEHAQKELPGRHSFLRGLPLGTVLLWEVASSRSIQEQDCYEVVVACYPDGGEVQAKGRWTYHVDFQGRPAPGTPVLEAELKWRPRPAPGNERIEDPIQKWLKTAQERRRNAYTETAPHRASIGRALVRALRWARNEDADSLARKTPAHRTRLIAAIMDYFIIWTLFETVASALGGLGLAYPFSGPTLQTSMIHLLVGLPLWVGFWMWGGQSPGKWILGLKVVTMNNAPLGFKKALLRYVGLYFSLTIVLPVLWILWDKERRGLHDRIAGTRVVRTR